MYQNTYANFQRKMKYIKIIMLFLIQDCGGQQDSWGIAASLRSLRDQWGLCMEVEDISAKQTVFPEQFFKRQILWEDEFKKRFHSFAASAVSPVAHTDCVRRAQSYSSKHSYYTQDQQGSGHIGQGGI